MGTLATDWTTAPVSRLVDHIVETHHEYLRRQLPRIGTLIADAHATTLLPVWEPFVEELNGHLWKEERILFPMIRALEGGALGASSHCGGVRNPIRVMLLEHDSADSALREMRRLANGYRAPQTASAALQTLYRQLEDLERDLREHIRKENDILFPRVQEME